MAERRMFAKSIIDSDVFLDMPATTQNLYFHLAMRADDDGFVNSPQKIMRMVSCAKNDMDMLVFKNFIIPFETGICVIKHWRIHNYLRSDRYTPTIYTEEKSRLMIDSSKTYTVGVPLGIPDAIPLVDVGKVSIDKNNKDKDTGHLSGRSSNKIPTRKVFIPPSLEEVTAYCDSRGKGVDPERWYDHYTANGWKVGKNQMKDWKAAVRTWERKNETRSDGVPNGPKQKAAYHDYGEGEARNAQRLSDMQKTGGNHYAERFYVPIDELEGI